MYSSRSVRVRSLLILTALLVIGTRTIVSAAGCSSANFKVASTIDFTRSPNFPFNGQTTADLNSDGKPDLILTDAIDNSISVLLNNGGALFGETRRYAVGAGPSQIAVADFNTDGHLDLAIANSESNHISILINTGAGQFASATNLSVGGPQGRIAVADFNNDTKSDLVTGTPNGAGINVFLGNGSGGFSLVSGSPFIGGSSIADVATADFNSDNKRDVVLASQTGVHLLLGDGTGALSAASQVYPSTSFAISSSDVNNDGKPDLVIGSSQLVIRLGDGAGGFLTAVTFPHAGGGLVFSVGVADIDGDGHQDVAAAVGSGVTFFKGNGVGAFSQTPSYIPALEPRRVSIADLDGDSDQDLVSGSSLLLNSGGGVFDAVRAVYAGSSGLTGSPREVASGDFNADGRTDIAVLLKPGSFGSHVVAVFLREVSGELTLASTISQFFANANNALEVGDFNNDGRSDFALAGSTTNSTLVAVSLSNGNGSFATPIVTNFLSSVSDTASGDFNADGNQDLVITSGFGGVWLLTGNGDGSFGQNSLFISGVSSSSVALSHLDSDNKLDLVVTDTTNRRVITFVNNGAGTFGTQRTFNLTNIPAGVVVADFNGDSKKDIAVSTQSGSNNQPQGTVVVLLGDGTGNLGTAVSYSAGDLPGAIASADFNGDSKLDLAVTNRSVIGLESMFSDISILSGDGAGGFLSPVGFPVFGNPGAFAVSDFDSDGRLDLAVPLSGPEAVGLFYGKSASSVPCLFADDVSVNEGDGPANTSVTIRLSEASTQPVQVNYLLKAEAAIENVDFQAASGIVVFQPGETTKQVALNIIDDNIDEDPEGMFLTLSFPQNASISDASAKILIFDNDPPPTISINDISVTEGNAGEVAATFTVSLSSVSSHGIFVNYITANGTATSGTDYISTQGTLIIGPGVPSQTITVGVKGDNTLEPDETFFVNLSSPVDATIADGQGQATILNNDPVPSISIDNASTIEVLGADHNVTATVRLSNPSDLTVTVDYATANDTAVAGADYVAASGTITFNPGETQKTFTVTIKEDTVDETIETFFINLSNPTNSVISDNQGSISIDDNDGPTISINDVSLAEGVSGNKAFTFTVSLSAPTVQVAGVRIATANGTAISGDDYQGRPGITVVIPAGMSSVTVSVNVFGDSVIESDETFFVNLSLPFGCTIADGQGVGTILNDDLTSVKFSATNASVSESAGQVTATVERVGEISLPFTAFYSTFDSSASQKSDFTAGLGKLDFAPGETTKTITVFITNDVLVENPEEFFIFLNGPNGSRVHQPSSFSVTINSDDGPGLPNPVDSSDFFVRQHYRDFLNRDPDPGGLAFWVNEIELCGADTQCREVKRINVSAAFFLSIEFQQTGYFAYKSYKAVFGDTTSPNVPGTVPVIRLDNFLFDSKQIGENVQVGIGNWQQQLDDNKNKYLLEFVARPQFITTFPISMTADQFVTKMNQQAGGVLSAEEHAELVAILGATPADSAKRAQVLRRVAEDSNLHQNESNRAFVLMQYYGYLRRNPDDPQDTDFAGWKFWLDKLNHFNGNFVDAEMVKAFLLAGEYRARFGN